MSADPKRVQALFLLAVEQPDAAARDEFLDRECGHDAELRARIDALLRAHDQPGNLLEPDSAIVAKPPSHSPDDTTRTNSPDAQAVAGVSDPGITAVTPPGSQIPGTVGGVTAGASDPGSTASPPSGIATGDHAPDPLTVAFGSTPRAHRATDSAAGRVIAGRYTLVELIGEGGMGSVYRAEQTKPVKRHVALKLIKAGMDSRAVLARFDAERQALALMDHPNIARVYDGGTTDTGQPFFVMELVKGVPITQYCDRARLPIRARLELFVLVCQAVQHAHQKGIIHRDLKPGNVLVTEVDGRPTPKVIDFGVAKATEQRLTNESFVDTGVIVGTPAYMSPEQADRSCMDIDTRTDVYALGVILYELLVGSPPIEAKRFKRMVIDEMLRLVQEFDPLKPSTKLSTADALPNIAANRNIEPTQLKRLLRGDLDWIVMKSLEKDRTRRYDTANGFAADILRHLAYEPVLAAPPSRAYRMQKFVRKNRRAVVAASLVVLALLGGIIGTSWGLIRADAALEAEAKRVKERDDALGERDTALGEAREALGKRDAAIKDANNRANELKHRLGISDFLLARAAYDNRDVILAAERLDKIALEQRGWEWQYLRRQTRGGIFTLHGHTGSVTSVSFSPDGNRIVTGSWDNTAKVWDARTGRPLLELKGHTDWVTGVGFISPDGTADARNWVTSVSFSPGGNRIVTGSGDGTAKVWDARTGTPLLELKGHTYRVTSVSFSPDGTRIVTGSGDYTAKVWDARTGTLLIELNGLTSSVTSVSFSPDGNRIVTGSWDNTAKVWDARTGTPLLELKGLRSSVTSVSFSPDGTRIVTTSDDNTARVWDARTGTPQLELKGHTNRVTSVSFSPDGTRIVTASDDNTARVWDARTGTPLLELKGHTGVVSCVSFSPDGTRILTGSGDETARVWEARMGTPLVELEGHTSPVRSVSFSPDGTRIVSGGGKDEYGEPGEAKVWNAKTAAALFDLKGVTIPFMVPSFRPSNPPTTIERHTGPVYSVSFSPDGSQILASSRFRLSMLCDARTGMALVGLGGRWQWMQSSFSPDGAWIATAGEDHMAKVWDTRKGTLLLELKAHTGIVRSVSFSPDGMLIATGSDDKTAKVWNTQTGMPLRELKGHTGSVNSVLFSPDGTRIITGSHDKTVRVWDVQTETALFELKGHTSIVRSVSFSPDGTRIVTGSDDKTVRVWDTQTGTPLLELKGHSEGVNSVSFSPDGTRIVTGSQDKTVKMWDTRDYSRIVDLDGHADTIWSVSFSPDSKKIVTGDRGGTVTLWNIQNGDRLIDLIGHTDAIGSVSFNCDGTQIVTGSEDGTAKVWDARRGTLLISIKCGPRPGIASFSVDGTRIVTHGTKEILNDIPRVWDALTGQKLWGPIPKTLPAWPTSPDGQFFAHPVGNRVELIPVNLNTDEITYRLIHTRPNYWRYREGYDAARKANDPFAARFYLDRLLSMPTQRTTARLQERNTFQADPLVIARTGFHHPALAKTPYDRGIVQMLANKGDRLAMRLVAQESLREGKPGPAVPMLFACLVSRPVTEPPAPPVEELLLARAYLALNQPDEAKRFHRVAAEWLDRAGQPIRAANIVTHCALTPWAGLGAAGAPVEDLRRNPFDWESWHECDVFRAEVERQISR